MSQLSEELILNSLKQIIDPDLRKDIVTLGFIRDLAIEGASPADRATTQGTIPRPPVAPSLPASMTLEFFSDNIANSVGDVTFVIAIQPDDAPAATLEQRQYGSGVGPWAWQSPDSDVVVFSDWESDWVVEATMRIEGSAAEVPFDLPPSLTDGEAMTVACIGDTLTTFTEGNPFIRYWTTTD